MTRSLAGQARERVEQRKKRLRAKLAEWDRARIERLLREAGRASKDSPPNFILSDPTELESILKLSAFEAVLELGDGSDEAIARAGQLVERMRRVRCHRNYLLESKDDPGKAIASSQEPDRPRALELLTAARDLRVLADDRKLKGLIEQVKSDKSSGDLELWARGYNPMHVGKSGRIRKKDDMYGRWRPTHVREFDELMPPEMTAKKGRYAVIAKLLTAMEIETTGRDVRSTLTGRKQ